MVKEKYYEEVLIKLKRTYGKDELVLSLQKEIGILKTQIDELDEFKYNVDKYIRQELNKSLNVQSESNKKLRKQIEQLKKDKNVLLGKINKYEKGIF